MLGQQQFECEINVRNTNRQKLRANTHRHDVRNASTIGAERKKYCFGTTPKVYGPMPLTKPPPKFYKPTLLKTSTLKFDPRHPEIRATTPPKPPNLFSRLFQKPSG